MPQTNFFDNTGGLNTTDGPFIVSDNQAVAGWNFNYSKKGSVVKSRDRVKVNTNADTQLKTLGLGLYNTTANVKTAIRAAGTKIQSYDLALGTGTNIAADTVAAITDFLSATSTQPVSFSQFNTSSANTLWLAGAGASSIYGYTGSKITTNGSAAPIGTLVLANLGSGTGGTWTSTGTYYYAVALRKLSTQAVSNAALDVSVAVATSSDTIRLTFPAADATLYDKWYVYRSAVSGVTAFTTGTLVAQVTVGTATYTDVGNVAVATSQIVPRTGNTTDNSVLPTATYNYITTFKRRLVAAQNSTFYLSDLDKPESWPSANSFTIPTGGNITGVSVIGYNAPISSTTDEYLVIFKETETWVFTGTTVSDWQLKFIDNVGCANQSLVIPCNGYIGWIDYRGVYLWNGVGKPIYVSRPIEAYFYSDGDIDKTKLNLGWGVYYKKQSQLIWCLSHRTKGENSFLLKLDLRLTAGNISGSIEKQTIEGVFTQGYMSTGTAAAPMYAGISYIPSDKEEVFLMGDSSGNIFRQFYAYTANGSGIDFQYETKHLNLGQPSLAKRFKKVVVWVEEVVHGKLTLQYWADYRIRNTEESQIKVDLDPQMAVASLWDLAIWDQSMWDDYQVKLKGLVFNLGSAQNNADGDSLKLRFLQQDANVPVTIHGFTVFWEEQGLRK